MDGGSDDGTLERIKATAGDVRWVTGVRGGIANAMNIGVEMAKGEFIAHLHGDDWYLRENVLLQVESALLHSNAEWLFGRVADYIDGELSYPSWTMPVFSFRNILWRNFIAHPAVFMRRQLFKEAGGFDATLKYAMDYDLWLKLSKLATPYYFPEYLAAFRRHSGSVSTANPAATFKEDLLVRLRYAEETYIPQAFFKAVHHWRALKRVHLG